MKLRVKEYTHGWWVVQRQWFGFLWLPVTKCLIFKGNSFMSSKRHPLLYRHFEHAETVAKELVQPGAMEKFQAEQDKIWAAAEVGFAAARASSKKIKVISS